MTRNVNTKRILKPAITKSGYYYVVLYNGKHKTHNIHRLVAQHFIPNIKNAKCIDHINNSKLDNTISKFSTWAQHGHAYI